MRARFYFKKLDDNSEIKEHGGISPLWTCEDMIWFAEKYYKHRQKVNGVSTSEDKALILAGVSNNEAEQCPYCGSYVTPITNADIIKALGNNSEVAVCDYCKKEPKSCGSDYCGSCIDNGNYTKQTDC